jgi:hypothetical protein
MEAQYKSPNGRVIIKVEADTAKGIFHEIALVQEVFDAEPCCGLCKNRELRYQVRTVNDNAYYELKCTDALEEKHLLQLALYGWLWNVLPAGTGQACAATHGARRLRLLNFRTGELLEVTSSPQELEQAARVLMEDYLRGDPNASDAAFLAECQRLRAPFLRAT